MDLFNIFAGGVGLAADDFIFFGGIIFYNNCINDVFDKKISNPEFNFTSLHSVHNTHLCIS